MQVQTEESMKHNTQRKTEDSQTAVKKHIMHYAPQKWTLQEITFVTTRHIQLFAN